MHTADVFVHYGDTEYRPELLPGRLQNHANGKPLGLWACAKEYDGWRNWCEHEDFHVENLSRSFNFKLKSDANILEIRYFEDIEPYLKPNGKYPPAMRAFLPSYITCVLDEEKFAWYDGMLVQLSDTTGFYGFFELWDVDSLVIWNDIVEA